MLFIEKGLAWALAEAASGNNKTVENMETVLNVANENGFVVFISVQYFYRTDSVGSA
jgi:hypothetical protein